MSAFIELLREHQGDLQQAYSLSHDMRRAIHALLRCQTEQQGSSTWQCHYCPHQEVTPLSCGHRFCPQCQQHTASNWLWRQQSKLLPTTYFMVTFTLPYELRPLATSHPRHLYSLMFKMSAQILKDFAAKQNKGELGFTSVLHTHSRQRNLHPHLHILVAGGRYDTSKQQWHKGNKNYLFNAFALAKVWRARMLDAINQHPNLRLPNHIPAKWVVDCRAVGEGLPTLKYLSRYLYRGVLADIDIINIQPHQVTFRYRDGQTKHWKQRTLPTLKFLMLILQHVLPKGLQRARDYGFLRGNAKAILHQIQCLLLPLLQLLLGIAPPSQPKRTCPCCQHSMRCIGISRPR